MARFGSGLVVCCTLGIVVGMVLFGEKMVVSGQVGCQGDMQGLITNCARYVQKGTPMVDPTEGCCRAVRTVDIPCVCQRLSKEVEQMVDMDKVFHLASFCGKPLAHGTKCGSSIVP